jgi:hypothetical protein
MCIRDRLYRFQRKTIFQTDCPHLVAVELKKAAKSLSEKNYADALSRYLRVLKLTKSQNARAVQGYLTARFFQTATDSARFADVFREADSLVKFIEKPEPVLFTVANAMLWGSFGNRDTVKLLLTRVYDAHLSFNFDYAAKLRISAIQSKLNMKYFYPLLSSPERDSLLKRQFAVKSDSSAQWLLQFIQAERLLAKAESDSALFLMQSLPTLPDRELEFQRRYDILETLLQLQRFEEAKLAVQDALESAQAFESRKAKEESVVKLSRLHRAKR